MDNIKLRGFNYFFADIHSAKKNCILLVHGHPFDHSMWKYQFDALNSFRLIIPDLKGYGKTAHDSNKIYIEEHALDLAFLLDTLDIDKVHLIGLSMGGQIIVEFARLFPHRTKSLIICDSNPSGETEASYRNRLKLADKMLLIGMQEYIQQDIHKYLHRNTVQDKGEAYNHLFNMMINTKVEGAVASHRGRAERRDNFSFLPQLKFPTLLIAGDEDYFTPINDMKNVADKIPDAEFVIIQNAGHMPNMEQPKLFNEIVVKFLAKQK